MQCECCQISYSNICQLYHLCDHFLSLLGLCTICIWVWPYQYVSNTVTAKMVHICIDLKAIQYSTVTVQPYMEYGMQALCGYILSGLLG
jgi:hypothetical protein